MSNFYNAYQFLGCAWFYWTISLWLQIFIQWIVSEKRGESTIPEIFWYLSMAGSAILFTYAIYRLDPVFIMGQCSGLFIYARNIMLIYKRKDSWQRRPAKGLISQKLLPNKFAD